MLPTFNKQESTYINHVCLSFFSKGIYYKLAHEVFNVPQWGKKKDLSLLPGEFLGYLQLNA